MKKVLFFVLAVTIVFNIAGCSKKSVKNESASTSQSQQSQGNSSTTNTSPAAKDDTGKDANVPEPTKEDMDVFNACMNYVSSDQNPSNQKLPANLSKEQTEQWNKEQATKTQEYEDNMYKEIAKSSNITPEQAKEIYLKVWQYRLSKAEQQAK